MIPHRMSLAAASLSEGGAEPSTESDDSFSINPGNVVARSFESIDSLYPNSVAYLNNSRQSLDSMGSIESLPRYRIVP